MNLRANFVILCGSEFYTFQQKLTGIRKAARGTFLKTSQTLRRIDTLKIVDVTTRNLEQEHICSAIGDDKVNCMRAGIKKAWLIERFAKGHTFKK